MHFKKTKIILTIISTLVIAILGVYYWQFLQQQESVKVAQPPVLQSSLKNYSSEKYSFMYPKEYKISEEGKGNTYILTTLKNDKSKLEIFIASEYPVDRAAIGFSGEETTEEAEAYIKEVTARSAKEYLKVGNYDVWLYYSENNDTSKKELKAIFESIVVK